MSRPRLLPLALWALLALPLSGCGAQARARAAHADALGALRQGDLARALSAAERAAEEGGERWRPMLDFVRANAAFARSLAAEPPAAAAGAGAGAGAKPETQAQMVALEQALVLAEDALAFWQRAATSRADWPAARRNVERALLRIEVLAARRPTRSEPGARTPLIVPGAGEQPGAGTDAPPDPGAPEPPPAPGPGEETATQAVTTDLPPESVARLGELLRLKEQQKQAARRARWAAPARTTERDW